MSGFDMLVEAIKIITHVDTFRVKCSTVCTMQMRGCN